MSEEIKFYYKNIMAEIIGSENGIGHEQLKILADKTLPVIAEINRQRKEGKT
jgi:hypothetical protein